MNELSRTEKQQLSKNWASVTMTKVWVTAIAFDLFVIAMCATYANVRVTEVQSQANVRISEITTLKK